MCVSGGKKCFSENLGCFLFLKHPFCDWHFCLITDALTNITKTIPKAKNSSVCREFRKSSKFHFSQFIDKFLKFEEMEHLIITLILKCDQPYLCKFSIFFQQWNLNQDITSQCLTLPDRSGWVMITGTSLAEGRTMCFGFMRGYIHWRSRGDYNLHTMGLCWSNSVW